MSDLSVNTLFSVTGKVAIVTGGSRGIGRMIAEGYLANGAERVYITARKPEQCEEAAAALSALGECVPLPADLADSADRKRFVEEIQRREPAIDILVNNAGILRDRMLFSMSEDDWDAVIAVHLKGTFAPSNHAAKYWREKAKAGEDVYGRIINTASPSGIYGNVGQTNYGAAKAGIAALTVISALEMARYGVTVNAVAPVALTRMTENLGPAPETEEEREMRSPRWIAPIATWLASEESAGVTGRVFEASGQFLAVAEGWVRGPTVDPVDDPEALGPIVETLLAGARRNSGMDGVPGGPPQPRVD